MLSFKTDGWHQAYQERRGYSIKFFLKKYRTLHARLLIQEIAKEQHDIRGMPTFFFLFFFKGSKLVGILRGKDKNVRMFTQNRIKLYDKLNV